MKTIEVQISADELKKKLKVKDGKPGTPGKKGDPGKDGLPGRDGSPDTPDEVVEKVNQAEKKIDPKQVKGLQAALKTVEEYGYVQVGGGGPTYKFRHNGTIISDHVTELNFSTNLNPTYDGNGRITLTATDLDRSAEWGQITGTLSDQADLQTALDAKLSISAADERAQDAVGTILTDSSEIDFTYNDATPSITASVVAGSIDEAKLDASVNTSLDLADSSLQPGGALGTPSSGTLTNATGLPIVAGTTGTLTAARGGTGLTTFGGANTILYTSAADTLTSSSNLTYNGTVFALTGRQTITHTAANTAFTLTQTSNAVSINVAKTRTNGNNGSNLLQITNSTVVDDGGSYNVNADVFSLTNSATRTSGTINSTANVFSLTQADTLGTGAAMFIDSNASGASAILIDPENTTVNSINVNADALTTGGVARFASNSADTGTRSLLNVINDNTAASGAVVLRLQQDSTADIVNFFDGATEVFTIVDGGNVGIGNASPNASAILDVASTTKAFMPPRMTTTQRDNITGPTAGMVIYNTTTNKLNVYTTAWEAVTSA